jgi:hypothetical protein
LILIIFIQKEFVKFTIFILKIDDYARKLFYKECFANQDHFSAHDPNEIIPIEYQERRNHDIKFKAFKPIVRLKSNKYEWYDRFWDLFKKSDENLSLKHKIYRSLENFDNVLGKSPLALRIVPLPSFTIDEIPKRKVVYDWKKNILNIFLFMFIPRWYIIGRNEKNLLSPFSRMILYEDNDNIYDNPATEAIINFRWQKARNFFFLLFLRFLVFGVCFALISWAYLNHSVIINGNFLFALIVIFYYLAFYQLVTEALQFHYRGFKKYFGEVFNSFDIIAIVFSVMVMSVMLKNFQFSNGFGSVKVIDTGLIAGISFSIFFLWIELVS